MAPSPSDLEEWCARWLGSPPKSELFASVGMSRVLGFRLVDGRDVVVKVRPAEARLYGCAAVHQHLWQAGYPCPEPLVEPAPIGDDLATAERYVPGGVQLEPRAETAEHYAWTLAETHPTRPGAIRGTIARATAALGVVGLRRRMHLGMAIHG
jgi:hypothetical protein